MVLDDGDATRLRNRWIWSLLLFVSVVALFQCKEGFGTLQHLVVVTRTFARNHNTNDTHPINEEDVSSRTTNVQGAPLKMLEEQDDKLASTKSDDKNDKDPKQETKSLILGIQNVLQLAKRAHGDMIARLEQDYGQTHFARIFQPSHGGKSRQAFWSAGVESSTRFKRKLKIKILDAILQTSQLLQQQHDHTSNTARAVNMIWATGGHSSAAGHGNLFNQSYTAVMEQTVAPVFHSVGIDFEGRNHAMGGTSSGPELGICSEAVFGTDIDVLSWDFGMMDGPWRGGEALYEQRAGWNPSRPVLVAINVASRKARLEQQAGLWKRANARGQAFFYLKPDELEDIKSNIPDVFGMSNEEIHDLPRLVRHFKCQGSIESGDPGCGSHKFSHMQGKCGQRKGRTRWHSGWKMQALLGNAMALFLADMLVAAIDELASSNASNRVELLTQLQKEEENDFELFKKTIVSVPIEYEKIPLDEDLLDDSNASIFFRSPSICHIASLPSQTRYLGILTESNQTGVHDYYKGIYIDEAKQLSARNDADAPMPLVWDNEGRDQECPLELRHDFKDFFFVSSKMGSASLTVPNAAELKAYGRTSRNRHGILVLCLVRCLWGKCPRGSMRQEEIRNGTVRLHVNGQLVTNATNFGSDCLVLRNEKGHRFQSNDSGQFVLRATILANNAILRLSSLVIF